MSSLLTAEHVYDCLSGTITLDCCPNEDPFIPFSKILNQAIERYVKAGRWKGMTSEIEVTVTSDTITLPCQYSSIIGAREKECDSYVPVFGIEHEYKATGSGADTCYKTLVDQGNVVNVDELDRLYMATGFEEGDVIKVLARHAYTPITSKTDYVSPNNIGALKFGLIAIQYEEQLDLAMSRKYWSEGFRLLDEELTQHLDGEHRTLPLQPWGLGISSIDNLY